jgi:hypothetical protein
MYAVAGDHVPMPDAPRPGDGAAACRVVAAHAPSWLPNNGTGSLATIACEPIFYSVIDAPRGNSRGASAELDLTVA